MKDLYNETVRHWKKKLKQTQKGNTSLLRYCQDYCGNGHFAKSNLQIQYSVFQNSNTIPQINLKNDNLKFHLEIQKTHDRQKQSWIVKHY